MHVRFPLYLRNEQDVLYGSGTDECRESDRLWGDRFVAYFASNIRKQRSEAMRRILGNVSLT